ncbi:MAG: SDR family oxidoreductase [Gammaproteobacteria bacterium]|nr:SDR family oxidoreductase [Gammaproteobacteria bacterium]MCH9743744.1 SDR family oxidoreductase [Gammaproteobacteria bacterium]
MTIYSSLKNKTVFITGGTSGIGEDIVLHFAEQGARVAFVGRNREKGQDVCDKVIALGFDAPLYVCCDVSDMKALQAAISQTAEHFDGIDVLVNNAANDQRHATLETDEAMWDQFMAVNLKHQFFAAKAVLPMMVKNGGGSIINMGSNCFMLADMPTYPCYAIAKSAIVGLTRSLAREFGDKNIRVNGIMPGWVMTEKQIEMWLTPEAEAETMREQCLKKRLYPEDVSRFVLFLASDDSKMVTKQMFVVDGGRI